MGPLFNLKLPFASRIYVTLGILLWVFAAGHSTGGGPSCALAPWGLFYPDTKRQTHVLAEKDF